MRLRPLARRRLNTSRPPRVDIRLRKPWRRERLMRLGWNVRFTDLSLGCGQISPTAKISDPPVQSQEKHRVIHRPGERIPSGKAGAATG